MACGWHLLREGTGLTEGSWGGVLRSQFPLLASGGRCFPPGVCVAVHTGPSFWLPAPSPMPFWLQRVSLLRWVNLTMALHIFACAAHRCLRDGMPGVRLPGSAVSPRFRPLRTSRRPGGYAVTPAPGGKGLHLHEELSGTAWGFAVCPRILVLFRPTGRTKCQFLYDQGNRQISASRPFRSSKLRSLSEGPLGCFSPISHCRTVDKLVLSTEARTA
jgi:hypothetical protein